MLPLDEYEEELEFTGGSFTPDFENLVRIHPGSSIIKTLKYINQITIEDENIIKYQDFTTYVKNKTGLEEVEEEDEDGED
jgi:hypothetical protein